MIGSIMLLKRRRYITLVEILIIVMILSMVTGVIAINVTRALKEQRFRTEIDLVEDTFRLAQDVMLVLRIDAHVRVKKAEGDKGIEIWVETDEPVPKNWEFVINRTKRILTATHSVQFEELNEFPIIEGELDIRFQSGGTMMSRGIFRMSTHEQEQAAGAINRAICLKGFPHPITSVPFKKDDFPECFTRDEEEQNNQLTRFTMQEVLEDVEAPKEQENQGQ